MTHFHENNGIGHKPDLHTFFDRLAQRLHKLKNEDSKDIDLEYSYKQSIENIITGGVLTGNLEDAEDKLHLYISEVEKIRTALTKRVKQSVFESQGSVFEPSTYIPADIVKANALAKLTDEVDYYHSELQKLINEVGEKQASIGSEKFSNAGFKIKLNLKVEEVGCLFNLLLESKVISLTNYDGSTLTKKKLAEFIQKNFSCTTTENIGINSIYNNVSARKVATEPVVEDILVRMLKILE
jgi:hypothetical protein